MKFLKELSTRKRIYLLLSLICSLVLVGIAIFLLTKPKEIEAGWWNETWTYRRSITLTNPSSTVENAQIKVFDGEDLSSLVSAGKLESSLNDLRFTDYRGNLLQYYIEDDTASAVGVWILIPSLIEGESVIFMYYGNSNVNSGSNSKWMADLGGEISYFEDYRIHAFLNTGSDTYISYAGREVDVLVIAGGGGGGGRSGGGGGAGGLVFREGLKVETGTQIINVGSGGQGGTINGTAGSSGENTSAFDLIALGGGGGGSDGNNSGFAGGSGGGGRYGASGSAATQPSSASGGYGNNGGSGTSGTWMGGGGGGSGGPGVNGTDSVVGDGGVGMNFSDFFSTNYGSGGWFGGGGGGGSHDPAPSAGNWGYGGDGGGGDGGLAPNDSGSPGTPNTGGGGGAGSTDSGTGGAGGSGGSGIVLVRYESDVNTPTDITIGSVSTSEEVSPAPIAYWRFDEGTGSTASDSSGKGNHGSVVGTPSWVSEENCVSGPCMQFNASEYVDLGNPQDLQITGSQTISMWLKPANFSARRNPYAKAYGGEGTITQETSGVLNYYYGTAGGNTSPYQGFGTSQSLTLNEWNHVVIVRDLQNMKLRWYINGKETNEANANYSSATASTLSAFIGNGYTSRYAGLIDEVKIYPYARTPEQIKTDYIAGSSTMGSSVVMGHKTGVDTSNPLSSKLLGYWKFDEGNGTTAYDSVGSRNLTFAVDPNTPSWSKEGRQGGSIYCDGNSFAIPSTSYLAGTSDHTYTAWFNLDSGEVASSGYKSIFGSNQTYPVVGYQPSNKRFYHYRQHSGGGQSIYWTVNHQYADNEWHHVTLTINQTSYQATLYVDGQYVGVNNIGNEGYTHSNGAFRHVCRSYSTHTQSYWKGYLDNLKIYNYALSPEEVLLDYNQGKTAVLGTSPPSTGNIWGGSSASEYCIPGDTSTCNPPVGEWLFNDNQGSTAKDTSGNNNNGTLVNSPNWVGGRDGGGALSFDGVNQSVSVTNDSTLAPETETTVEAWIKPTDTSTTQYIANHGHANGNKRWWLRIENNTVIWGVSSNCDSHSYLVSSSFTNTNVWSHIAVTYKQGEPMRMYINGTLANTGTVAATICNTGSEPLTIGVRSAVTQPFQGDMDRFRIYDYARTPAQIMWDYNKGGPVGHWRLDECQGTTVHDISGNNNHGTINIGSSGTQTSAGTCTSGNTAHAWYNGREGTINSSLSFDGTDDYVDIPSNNTLRLIGSNLTVSGWVYLKDSNNGGLVYKGRGTIREGYGFYQLGTDIVFIYSDTYETHDQVYTSPATFGRWFHAVSVIDKTNNLMRVYIDGKLNGTLDISGINEDVSGTYPLQFGRSDSFFSNASIDDVRIYNYPLTEEQVKLLYNHNSSVRF